MWAFFARLLTFAPARRKVIPHFSFPSQLALGPGFQQEINCQIFERATEQKLAREELINETKNRAKTIGSEWEREREKKGMRCH